MDTKQFRNTTFTVIDSRRGWQNDRTIFRVRGPKDAEYSLVEFDSGYRVLTDVATGRSRKWHNHDLGAVREASASCTDASQVVTPNAPVTESQTLTEYHDDRWGWDATQEAVERHTAQFADALDGWQHRDRENPHATYAASLHLLTAMRSLSADTAQLARLAAQIENRSK